MKYYPIQLDIRNKNCLVVGGGDVGTRKAMRLLTCGAKLTVVSTFFSSQLLTEQGNSALKLKKKAYDKNDLKCNFLVVGATNNESLNQQISEDAELQGILCNIVDRPKVSNFILPSIISSGDLTITISTSGQSPAFAKHLRRQMESEFGSEYANFLALMGKIRNKLLEKDKDLVQHKNVFKALIRANLLGLIQKENIAEINHVLQRVLGDGFEYSSLMNNVANL